MRQKIYIFLVVVVIFLLGFVAWNTFNNKNQTTQSNQNSGKNKPLPKEILVQLDKNGFSPKEVTIKKGTAIRWKNTSGKPQTVNSDEYPTNQLHKELNFGVFNNGSSHVYVFAKPGTYGYHNQYHKEQKGKIIVTQ